VSKFIALKWSEFHSNQLTSSVLNALFASLPVEDIRGKVFAEAWLECSDNPGYDSCDKSIASNKGWVVL
jgi:hypothetical protein